MKLKYIGAHEPRFDVALRGNELCEVSCEWYWQLYNAVPPIGLHPCWMVGEPASHDEEFNMLYHLLFAYGGKFYAVGQPQRIGVDRRKVMSEFIAKYNL